MAQDAVAKGDLVWWGFLRTFNATADGYNFMFVNVYKDIDAAVSKANWWNNAKEVVGIEPSILMDAWVEDAVFDRRYIYQFRQQINSDRQGKFLILILEHLQVWNVFWLVMKKPLSLLLKRILRNQE